MYNEDGSYGARWTMDQTKQVQEQRGIACESSEANRGRKGGARERALEGKGVCGKTVEVFLRDFNQPAAAAPFALAKGEGTKRGRQA